MTARMDRIFFSLLAAGAVMGLLASWSLADTGPRKATRVEVGNSPDTFDVSLDTGIAQVIAGSAANRPDLACMNSTDWVLRITTFAITNAEKSANLGLPVISSATIELGAMGGPVFGYFDADAGAGTQRISCWRGRTL